MCGIAGIVRSDDLTPDLRVLGHMTSLLRHRGPDGSAIHADGRAALAHTRLSIIDLVSGTQPMSNEDGTLWVTFNGEIYNYPELRDELVARGHRFKTRSDTEVIVHAYEEFGPECVRSFNGQFAFAIWDGPANTLVLARDRAGKKPLYYAQTPHAFVFGSEMKAVLAHPGVDGSLDPFGLDQVLTFWCTVAPRTAFAGVRELPPGHILTLTRGAVSTRRYWDFDFSDTDSNRSVESFAEELRALLVDAVRIRMLRSDVPVGAYVSGGLDSAIVAGVIRRYMDVPLKTFSLAFEDAEFDERRFQRDVTQTAAGEHHETVCRTSDIGRAFPDVVWHAEQPLVRTAPAPMFLLSKLVREQGYKVVLTGEGSDEILGGYDIFKEAKLRRFCAAQPASRRRPELFKRLYPYLPALQKQSSAQLRAFFDTRGDELENPFFSHLPRWQMTSGIKRLLSDDVTRALDGYSAADELRAALPPAFARWDPFSRAQYLESSGLLPGYILSSQGDRVQMAHSVEGRCPFLDYRLMEFAGRVPAGLKMKALREKYLLKKATADLVPASLQRRAKQPYRAADVTSFFSPTGAPTFPYVDELLSSRDIAGTGLFNADAVDRLVRRARAGQAISVRDGMALVFVLSTQLLATRFAQQLGKVA